MKTVKAKVKIIKKITKPKIILSKEELPIKKQKNYFTIKELCYSSTAEKYNIDNTPNEEIIKHLNEFIQFLNPLREKWGSPIHVNSGYRSEKLNARLKGATNSGHKFGWCADLRNAKGTRREFYNFMLEYLKDYKYDECFIETNKTSSWIHFAWKGKDGRQRMKNGAIQA